MAAGDRNQQRKKNHNYLLNFRLFISVIRNPLSAVQLKQSFCSPYDTDARGGRTTRPLLATSLTLLTLNLSITSR